MTVTVTRLEHTPEDLRREAARTRDAKQARRMLAIALILEGGSREEAARSCAMQRQTLRDWVHRYNAEGLAGLRNRTAPGRQPSLSPAQQGELAAWIEQGADPDRDGVVRWRRTDLRARIVERFGVPLHERTVGKLLHKLGFPRLSARPKHPASDPAAQEAFKKTSRPW
jgi:transposase